uniref:Uncharacterized protein n=1 Tax=Candidatus Kentrum sp. MB TaxID=2138164 RepID=A0A450Y2D8_9GAMM|nr:MAG: hypothetical protein BECKMB1821I_GA0114274_11317 [Candidatus Kentron sp. MB]VFK77410.1 MAG: hypothetical protein BECKMB1821H_GA0114242_11347 [Candidatus Kentron sp. MB]
MDKYVFFFVVAMLLLAVVISVAFNIPLPSEFVAKGKITGVRVADDDLKILLSSTEGCPSGWYSARENNIGLLSWKMMFDLALSAYENNKTVSIFYRTPECREKKKLFIALEVVG